MSRPADRSTSMVSRLNTGTPLPTGGLEMIKPKRLWRGSQVAAVSLSWGGPGALPHRYAAGKRQFEEEFGVTVTETAHALREPEWLARNPGARAEDLMAAFADPDVDGIISTIGGDDSIRLLPYLDLDVIYRPDDGAADGARLRIDSERGQLAILDAPVI